jgi:hypothetical protein
LKGKCKLFEGSNQYDCFRSLLHSIVTSLKHKQIFTDLGMPTKYFGIHSIRKGAVTHIACGCTSSPPICLICIQGN